MLNVAVFLHANPSPYIDNVGRYFHAHKPTKQGSGGDYIHLNDKSLRTFLSTWKESSSLLTTSQWNLQSKINAAWALFEQWILPTQSKTTLASSYILIASIFKVLHKKSPSLRAHNSASTLVAWCRTESSN